MTEPVNPSVGWGVLHLFCRARPGAGAKLVTAAVEEFSGAGEGVDDQPRRKFGPD